MTALRAIALCGLLVGCQPLPVMNPEPIKSLSAWQQPACLFWCVLHLSLIRDETLAESGATVTGGSNATSSSSTNTGGGVNRP